MATGATLCDRTWGCIPRRISSSHRERPDISFYCDDIAQTVADLRTLGVEFTQDVQDHGYGLVTYFKVPGDFQVQLYQPKYSK